MKKLTYQIALILTFLLAMTFQVTAQTDHVYMLRWSSDGELLAVAKSDGVEIYDETLSLVQTIHPNSFIVSVDWHPDGTQLALTRENGVEIWTRDNNNLLVFSEQLEMSDIALAVFWNADGSRLAAFNGVDARESPASQQMSPRHRATIVIWNTETRQIVGETTDRYLIPDFEGIYRFAWHPSDLYTFVVAGIQTYIDNMGNRTTSPLSAFITNSETGAVEYIIEDVARTRLYGVTWCPDGSCITVSDEPATGVFSVSSGEGVEGYFIAEARNLQWRSDGAYLYADGGLFEVGNPDSVGWYFGLTTWHPANNTLTAIVDGLLISYDLTDMPGYVPLNTPPTADAGADQTLTADGSGFATVTLDGSASFDPDGEIISYVWVLDSTEIATGAVAQVQLGVGVHEVTLTVTDDDGAVDVDTVTITIIADEIPTPTPTSRVSPVVECVIENYDAQGNTVDYTVFFGYNNLNTVTVNIPVGANNRFSPAPQDRGQTEEFLPGRQIRAFSFNFVAGNQVWSLRGPDGSNRTATASANTQRCPEQPAQPGS